MDNSRKKDTLLLTEFFVNFSQVVDEENITRWKSDYYLWWCVIVKEAELGLFNFPSLVFLPHCSSGSVMVFVSKGFIFIFLFVEPLYYSVLVVNHSSSIFSIWFCRNRTFPWPWVQDLWIQYLQQSSCEWWASISVPSSSIFPCAILLFSHIE